MTRGAVSRPTAVVRWALCGLVVAVACGGDPPPPPPTGPGIPRDLATFRKATIDSVRYAYRLHVPERRDAPVTGEATIRFRRDDPDGRDVVLDLVEPGRRIRAARVEGEQVQPVYEDDHLLLPGDAFPSSGEVAVELEFEAGDGALTRADEFLYALFVPDRAHFTLPLFDQPDLKARFRLDLEVPGAWRATSNGRVLEELVLDHADGSATSVYRFAETEPIPTYLFTFAAGRFERLEAERAGRTLSFHHRETDSAKVARNLETIFDLHGTALEWLEEYADRRYPFGSFGFVAVPAFQYGGMEHPGAIYYRAEDLFLDESATQRDLLGRASVIAHETAHMWFGNLVTMPWFDDVWMKEVFASFMATKIVHPSFPEVDHDLRFYLSNVPGAYAVDRTAGTHPIRQELENLNEAGTLYGAMIYQKAPIVMRQLELLVGEDVLREGLRRYLDRYAYASASWPDLVGILDGLAPEDVTTWSRVWVEEAGRPTIRVQLDEEPEGSIERLVLVQEDPDGRGRRWPQTLHVGLGYGSDSVAAVPVRLHDEVVEVEEARGRATPDFVLPGVRGDGYGHVRLDPVSRAWLLEELPGLGDPLARAAGWVTLRDALLEEEVAPGDFADLLFRGLERESVELVVERLLGDLRTTWWRFLGAEERRRRAPELEELLWSRLLAAPTATLRASLFAAYRDVALSPAATERLHRIWAGEEEVPDLPLSERDRTELARELALREVGSAEEILDRQLERIENPDRRERLAFIRPSLSPDPRVRERFFESLRDPAERARERWVADAVSNLHHPLRAEHAERFIRPSLEMLEEIQRTGDIFFPQRWLGATLGGHSSPSAAGIVRGFLRDRPELPERLRRKVLQEADLLFRAARISGSERITRVDRRR